MLLVDTNVLSELIRPRPHPSVVRWAEGTARFSLSVVTLEEVWYGLACRPSARLETWMRDFVAGCCDVLPVTTSIARRCADLRAAHRAAGRPRTQADMLIAATAGEHGLSVVTRNVQDFAGCGVRVIDPFVR